MTAEQFLELQKDPLEKYKKLYQFSIEFSNKAHFMKGYGDLPYQAHLFDVEYVIVKFGYGEETVLQHLHTNISLHREARTCY